MKAMVYKTLRAEVHVPAEIVLQQKSNGVFDYIARLNDSGNIDYGLLVPELEWKEIQ